MNATEIRLAIYTRFGYVETQRRLDEGYRRVFMEKSLGDGG